VLRYLSPDPAIAAEFQRLPQPAVTFNYTGPRASQSSLFRFVRAFGGYYHDEEAPRPQLLQVTAGFVGEGQLQVNWDYSENIHQRATIEGLAASFLENVRLFIP
jgi:non-ribosomal peptide synthase protein (TIGR01720 family)